MKRIAKFDRVSKSQFIKDAKSIFCKLSDEQLLQMFENIILPSRATGGSAGYDFFCPIDISLQPNQSVIIPTGIRAKIEESWVLKIYPRSGLGFKYRLQLDNTVGIIDSDYFYADNEGHILIKITNCNKENKTLKLTCKTRFAQGIFIEYGITCDDTAKGTRKGGFGSTD